MFELRHAILVTIYLRILMSWMKHLFNEDLATLGKLK